MIGIHTRRTRRIARALSLAGALLACQVAAAEEPEVLTLPEAATLLRLTPAELEAAVARGDVPARRIGSEWRFARRALLDWLAGAEPPPPLTADDLAGVTAAGTAAPAGAGEVESIDDPDEAEAGDEDPDADVDLEELAQDAVPIGEAPDQPTAEEVFLRTESVLLHPGEFTVEPAFFYFERDEDLLVFSEGVAVGLAELDERAYTVDLRSRVGIFEETELFAGLSWSDVESDVEFGGTDVDEFSRSEFGDLRLGVRRTLIREGVGYPDVVLNLGGRIPVQKGSYGIDTALALVKSIDPVVLFANLGYRHTFSKDFDDPSRLQPEDVFSFGAGFAYSLNDAITLSTQVAGVISGETKFDDVTLRQNEIFFLELGMTARLARSFYVEPTVSFSLNGDDDRMVLGITTPFTFRR